MARSGSKRLFTAEMRLLNKLETMSDMVALPTEMPADPNGSGGGPDISSLHTAIEDLKLELLSDIRVMIEEQKKANAAAVPDDDEQADARKELRLVKNEVRALANSIQETKKEIAALYTAPEDDSGTRINIVKGELDSVVAATEDATANILETVEKIDAVAHNIRSAAPDDYTQGLADDIVELVVKVFESCNFQDLTGQRITKVVNTMKYIEERVNRVIEIWGEDDFGEFDLPPDPKGLDNLDKTVTKAPQNANRVSQDEVDQIFSQEEIDALFD
jgi:chemotaxis protein CheZ